VIKEINEDADQQGKSQQEGIYIVENDRVKFHPVQKGIMGELKIEIISGLEKDQEIVVGPYSALRELKDDKLIKAERNRVESK